MKQEFAEFKELVEHGPTPRESQVFPTVLSPEATQAPVVCPQGAAIRRRAAARIGADRELTRKLGLAGVGPAASGAMDQQEIGGVVRPLSWPGEGTAGRTWRERPGGLGVARQRSPGRHPLDRERGGAGAEFPQPVDRLAHYPGA